jgi:DNA-binding cell septation regulator SpoVG
MSESKVSDVKLKLWENKNGGTGAVAHGSFILFDAVRVDCTVVSGSKGIFVSLPRKSYKPKNSDQTKYRYTTYIEDETLRKEVTDVVLAEYNRLTNSAGDDSGSGNTDQDNYPY